MQFDVTLDRPSSVPIMVRYQTGASTSDTQASEFVRYFLNTDGTYQLDATGNPVRNEGGSNRTNLFFADYNYADGLLTFLPGETRKTIAIDILADVLADTTDETFTLHLRDGVGATILRGTALGTIIDTTTTGAANPTISLADMQIAEPIGIGTLPLPMRFAVTLSAAAAAPVIVNYAATGLTATAGADFTAVSGSLTFAAGETTRFIDVAILGDAATEATETLSLTLSGAMGGTLGRAVATGRILDTALPNPWNSFSVTSGGVSSKVDPTAYTGPVAGLQYEFLGSNTGEAVSGTAGRDFMNLFGGDDAANGGAGDDVIDGGLGSNFLTGGAGRDTFFLDGRAPGVSWGTIADWETGEQLSIWGWRPGVSNVAWVDRAGAGGYEGATLHIDLDRNASIDISVTWSGWSRADLPTPVEFSDLLWFV
jgi:hypothetical protein